MATPSRMTSHLLVQMLQLALCLSYTGGTGEIFASVDGLRRLAQTEEHFLGSVDEYLTTARQELNVLVEYEHLTPIYKYSLMEMRQCVYNLGDIR